jgi:putative hydrolase of the HAD superfamily
VIEAVIFDLGGVVMASPLHAITRYERDHGLPVGAINRVVVESGDGGAWSRLERGELTVEAFLSPFEADCRACGVELSGEKLMAYIVEAGVPRPRMIEAIRLIRARGLRVAALTNNWVREGQREGHRLREHFDVFVESAIVGLRKPARTLGMSTIKVDDPAVALRELGALLGFDLLG